MDLNQYSIDLVTYLLVLVVYFYELIVYMLLERNAFDSIAFFPQCTKKSRCKNKFQTYYGFYKPFSVWILVLKKFQNLIN